MKTLRIGEPLDGVAVWATAYGTWQGADRIYAVSSGSPCILFVLDPSGEQAPERYALEGSDHCWGVVLTTSGVYIGEAVFCTGSLMKMVWRTWVR